MAKIVVVDLETNGLLHDTPDKGPAMDRVWCGVTRDLNTGEVRRWFDDDLGSYKASGTLREMVEYLEDADVLVGHNIVGFDYPVLREKLGLRNQPELQDTLVLSRLMFPRIGDYDKVRRRVPSELFGSHSLKAWGYRLRVLKGEYGESDTAFTKLTKELVEYCQQDVVLCARIFQHLSSMDYSRDAADLEHRFAAEIALMMRNGFPFDLRGAQELEAKLDAEREVIDAELHKALGTREIRLKTKVKIEPVNLNSGEQIAQKLTELWGWEPTKFLDSGKPAFDEEVVNGLPDSIPVKDLLIRRKEVEQGLRRLRGRGGVGSGLLNSFVQAGADEYWIHPYVNHNGARSGRCTHSRPNINMPRVGNPWGKEFRSLVVAPDGYFIVGWDASGIDARMLAHYLVPYDGGRMVETVLSGDLHDNNQKLLSEILPGISRSTTKNVFYATMYGAQAKRVGETAGVSAKIGGQLRQALLSGIPGLQSLFDAAAAKAKSQGFLKGLDGRKLEAKAAYAALNIICQGGAAVVIKEATCLALEYLRAAKIDARLILHVHDEMQILCPDAEAHRKPEIERLLTAAITDAGKKWGVRCPLAGETRFGKTWAETH